MSDYIKRETAIAAAFSANAIGNSSFRDVCDTVKRIRMIPAADVVECKHGKWMPIYDGNEFGEVYQSGVYCSECDEELQSEPNYCPNCGANMRQDPLAEKPCDGCDYDKCTIAETGSCDEARMNGE